ncbi:MAG TPA: sialidase family protein [Actinomycetota bacterium]|nr:sialidase family protein [Actinomycetota bacterium]
MSRPRSSIRTRSLLLLIAASLALATMSPGVASAVPANVNVSARPGNEAEDAIAVNPTDPSNIVAMSTLPGPVSGLFVGTSFDGGATWTRRIIGDGSDQLGEICCDQQLSWDEFGNLWMVYLFSGSNGNVPIALSTDGGLTFQKVAEIVPIKPKGSRSPKNSGSKGNGLAEKGIASADQPSISAAAGSVWVSYTVYPSTVVQGSGAVVTGLGQFGSFGTPQNVPTSKGKGNYGDTAVGPDGQVMVIYQDQTSGQGGARIYTALDPDGLGPDGFDNPRFFARTRVGGFDYLPVQPDRSVDAEASLAWDRSGGPFAGRVYAIWTQELKNESDNMDIRLQISDDNGTSWSRAVRLNDDVTRNSQVNPAIALDQTTGNVAISWYDARNDQGDLGPGDTDGVPNDDVQIWATYSTDGGATFVSNFRVSEGTSNSSAEVTGSGFNFGDYTHAAFESGTFYPAWSDNSNSTGDNPDGTLHQLDLYTAAVAIP